MLPAARREISPLYLPIYLPYLLGVPAAMRETLHLPHISPVSPLYLPYISRARSDARDAAAQILVHLVRVTA